MASDQNKLDTGWSNYETWCVNEWLPTDETIWNQFREQLRRLVAKRQPDGSELDPITPATRRILKFRLARQLRYAVERLDYTDLPGIYCDLLESSLARVNWPEIVDYCLRHPFPKQAIRPSPLAGALRPLFEPGRVFTAGAAESSLAPEDVKTALHRHVRGDWGILDADDRRENMRALAAGRPVQSVYEATAGTKFWVVTEADRSLTSVLLAEDY